MKILTKVTVSLATSALLFVGCSSGDAKTAKPHKVVVKATAASDASGKGYITDADLLKKNAALPTVSYNTAPPGAAKRIKRAFQDAPPMIPHSTEGLLPITKNNNACLGCHMPNVAKMMGATPIPVSHFTNFRPDTTVKDNKLLKNGKAIKNTSSESLSNVSIKVNHKENKLYPGRYNCSQCHAPQATNKLVDKNSFKPLYTAPDGNSKSSWNQSKWMKDINTQKTSQ